MKGKNYSYESELDMRLSELEEKAKKEKYFDSIKPQLDQIKSKVSENHKNELTLYKYPIKKLLEEDIISRYYLERGSVENHFKNDNEVAKAVEVLNNPAEYKRILNVKE